MKTFIIGHKKPDTDSVVSAMALEYLYSQKECFGYDQPQAKIVDPLNPETNFLFEKFGVKAPQLLTADQITDQDQIVLVDHNEENQRLDGLNPDQIVDIVDHHKANLNLSKPIYMTFKTWGSSAAIVYFMMQQNNVVPTKELASLMLCAVLSDTIGFRGPTTTPKDKELAQELAKIAEINDIDALALEIFKAKSNISKLTDAQIVTNDYKIFEFGDKKVMINQLETVEQDVVVNDKKEALLTAMAQVKQEQSVDLIFMVVTDVLLLNSKMLILSEQEKQVAQQAFGGQVVDQIIDIGARMSRKKEIAPLIEKAIK